jgi:hypothetical protein
MAPVNGTEPTELIYLPSTSWAPVIVAAGTFMGWFLWLVGAFLLFLGARSWWRTSDDEISRMRREQHTDTAVLPADPIPARTPRS